MPYRPSRTTLARAAIFLAALTSALPLRAADEFKVTPAQMQALGIQLQRLDKPSPITGLAYPARVVLRPPAGHRERNRQARAAAGAPGQP